jgi:hypothetical protein
MKKFLSGLLLPFFLVACGSDENNAKKDLELPEVSSDVKNEVVYAIPSPNEQFDLLHALGGELIPGIVHDLSQINQYNTTMGASLNFGIYTADAAYMMRFNQGKKVFMDYVSALDRLGDHLGIANIYGDELIEAIEEAQENAMMLYDISSDNYLKVYDKMIENEKEAELSLILAGGWVETMYILFESAGDFGQDMEIELALVEQIYVLDNLINFMSNYADNEYVGETLTFMMDLANQFSGLDCESSEVEVKQGQGTYTLLGGDSCLFTQDSFNGLRDAVNGYRTKFIGWL